MNRKMSQFGHVARMGADRKLKTVMFGVMDGKNKRGRPHNEWADDVEDRGENTLQKLYHLAQDRDRWRLRIKLILGGLRARRSWCIGLPAVRLGCLERVIRTAARLIGGIPRTGHVSAYMLDVLHWLPLQQRIMFRIGAMVWRCILGLAPA